MLERRDGWMDRLMDRYGGCEALEGEGVQVTTVT